jgi:hypothetical protein
VVTPRRAPCATTTTTNDLFNNVGLFNKDIDALIESQNHG